MKKVICLLVAVLMALALFSCSASPAGDSASPPADSNTQSSPAGQDNTGTPDAQTPASDSSPVGQTEPEDDLSYILNKGKLVIGITPYEPMNYEDENGKLVGFDTEFAEALCAKLGVTPEFKWIDWGTKEIELKARNIDCIWNGLTVTEERRENMAFSLSYLRNEQAVVIRKADETKFNSLDSLKSTGVTVVAEEESAGATAVENDLPDAKFKPVDSQAKALLEVKAGTADVAVIDYTMARAMTGEGTDFSDLILVSAIKMLPEEYAIGLRLDSPAVESFNEIILELRDEGLFDTLGEKYDVSDLLIKE